MNRFFVEENQIVDDLIKIVGEDVKHIKNVLRLKEGREIEIISKGYKYLSIIEEINSNNIICKIIKKSIGENEAPIDIYLYQGIAKNNNMDIVIQKATEIGVKKIFPLETDRTVVVLKEEKKKEARIKRWNQIALEAAKQSKRDIVPVVEDIIKFSKLSEKLKDEKYIIMPYELEDNKYLKEALSGFGNDSPIHIIIGPEGGFTEEEVDSIIKIGGNAITLGPRILRTETAGVIASSLVLYEFGDLGVRR